MQESATQRVGYFYTNNFIVLYNEKGVFLNGTREKLLHDARGKR